MPESPLHQAKAAEQASADTAMAPAQALGGPSAFLVIGIGTSAGGLDATKKLIGALPADSGMAFVLVQHMDPNHESMLVELLAAHTSLTVRQATNGEPLTPNTIHVIPPGAYLSTDGHALLLSPPAARHGARMPFDFLLKTMAAHLGPRAVGVVLSGTGADGVLGLKALKLAGGLAIAQDPAEAAYDGMPRSAIGAGLVDMVLPAAEIAAALDRYSRGADLVQTSGQTTADRNARSALTQIIELLRVKTAHDFRLYKRGTLHRRIERRMAMAAVKIKSLEGYLDHLRGDAAELDRLAKDLLINVTSFFRDPSIFQHLAEETIPGLVSATPPDQPLRIWIAGCSTGEEAYSLTMLFLERITASQSRVKLQVFASDVDAEAITVAREGLYPATIEANVSPERLANFFTKEGAGYRISAQLRAYVVFTVQDILSDPPFSRIDFVSCRNLLIYLRPEAQAKALVLFHFALRQGGLLLLGSSETVGAANGRFEMLSRPSRLYRHVGRSKPSDLHLAATTGELRPPPRAGSEHISARPAALAALCQRHVLENYAPAAVLINQRQDCLFSIGATDRYLKVAVGFPDQNLLSVARADIRPKLRSAIARAAQERTQITVSGGNIVREGGALAYDIAVYPITHEGEDLLLVCFVDAPPHERKPAHTPANGVPPSLEDLERELETTRAELRNAVRDLEVSGEEQKAVNAEALSVNEEYQAANEELVASKEELQSLNEELTALNSQIQETLERQRTTSNDLQNVLYSTNVATLFLDTELKIRFFTPSTRSIFSVIPGDVGRPLADLSTLATDGELLTDARAVLQTLVVSEREIESRSGTWYTRRILPYRTQGEETEGVVITYVDVTERRLATQAVEAAKHQAERANTAKSRFLAAASHDLRQPLQTLVLIQGLLAKTAEGDRTQALVERLADTLGAMSGMLNALLDINQIEAGTVRVETSEIPLGNLLERMLGEFAYHALAKNLTLRVAPCSLIVHSDPRLLEQMVRNLVSNALKYTKDGKVLLGCRRQADTVSLEVWDTGIGIRDEDLQAIFEEYHQLDNPARESSRGLGLGLSIVQRLGDLLGHRVHVRSRPGMGSVFTISLPRVVPDPTGESTSVRKSAPHRSRRDQAGTLLLVEDDPDVRELLELALRRDGHRLMVASDGVSALDQLARGNVEPDLILADYNLPNGITGLALANRVRAKFQQAIPVIILTGDISTGALREIAAQNCLQLNKPVKLAVLSQAIQHLLLQGRAPQPPTGSGAMGDIQDRAPPVIFIVDDDHQIRANLRLLFEHEGRAVEDFEDCEGFLRAYGQDREGCLLVDAYLPGMSGVELLQRLRELGRRLPAIMITGKSDVHMAVQAMKAGASDFIEKPVAFPDLLISVDRALEQSHDSSKLTAWRASATAHLDSLTSRQRQIMDLVLAGHPSKNIAADLHISQRTVENHRASIMKKTGAKSLPALARLALAAASDSVSAIQA